MSGLPIYDSLQYVAEIKAYYAHKVVTFLVIGIGLFMVLYGLSLYFETPKSSRDGRLPFILTGLSIWSFSTLVGSLDAWMEYEVLFAAGPNGVDYFEQVVKQRMIFSWYQSLSFMSMVVYMSIGVAFMLYRCVVMWPDKWTFLVPPVAVLQLLSIILGILTQTPAPFVDSGKWRLVFIAWAWISVAVNIAVTVIMFIPLLRARREHLATLANPKDDSPSTANFALIVESASPLALFGIVFAIVILFTDMKSASFSPIPIAESVCKFLYVSFAGLSPLMVIFRITTQRSFIGAYDKKKASQVFSRPLEFIQDEQEASDSSDSFDSSGPDTNTFGVRERKRDTSASGTAITWAA